MLLFLVKRHIVARASRQELKVLARETRGSKALFLSSWMVASSWALHHKMGTRSFDGKRPGTDHLPEKSEMS